MTCGGLCPGLNDVIRALVMELAEHYGISEATGFRNGYLGLTEAGPDPVRLDPDVVHHINQHGGTMLGTSRGSTRSRGRWSTAWSTSASTSCS